jgi:outer membrane protein
MLNRLKNAMGMAMNQPLLISVSIPDGTGALSNIPGLGDEFRPENRADFKSEMLNITIQYQEKQRVLAGYAPKLTAYAQLGAQAFGNQFDQSFKDWYDYSAIGLKLQVPIFDGLYKRAKTNEAKVTLDNAKKNLELDRQSFSLDYQNSTNQLKSNSDNVENDKQNLALAREVYSNTTLQYQEGTATLTDLLNDESSLKNAQTNYVTSLLNYYIAKLNLEKSKGTLKNYYQSLNK